MIVCLCRGVTDRVVTRVIAEGASSVDDIGAACGAGSECGGCRPMLRELLAVASRRRCPDAVAVG